MGQKGREKIKKMDVMSQRGQRKSEKRFVRQSGSREESE